MKWRIKKFSSSWDTLQAYSSYQSSAALSMLDIEYIIYTSKLYNFTRSFIHRTVAITEELEQSSRNASIDNSVTIDEGGFSNATLHTWDSLGFQIEIRSATAVIQSRLAIRDDLITRRTNSRAISVIFPPCPIVSHRRGGGPAVVAGWATDLSAGVYLSPLVLILILSSPVLRPSTQNVTTVSSSRFTWPELIQIPSALSIQFI